MVRVEAGDFRDELVDALWHHQRGGGLYIDIGDYNNLVYV